MIKERPPIREVSIDKLAIFDEGPGYLIITGPKDTHLRMLLDFAAMKRPGDNWQISAEPCAVMDHKSNPDNFCWVLEHEGSR